MIDRGADASFQKETGMEMEMEMEMEIEMDGLLTTDTSNAARNRRLADACSLPCCRRAEEKKEKKAKQNHKAQTEMARADGCRDHWAPIDS